MYRTISLVLFLSAAAITVLAQVGSHNTVNASVGQTVNLSCEYGEPPYQPLLTTWRHNGTVIIPQNSSIQRRYVSYFDAVHSKALLEIPDITFSDAGRYTCKFIHSDKSPQSWTLHVLPVVDHFLDVASPLLPTLLTAIERENQKTSSPHSFVERSRSLSNQQKHYGWVVVVILILVSAPLCSAGIVYLVKGMLGKFRRTGQYDNTCGRTLPSVPKKHTRKEPVETVIYNDITEISERKEIKEMKYMKGDRTLLRENKQTEKIREEAIVFEMQLKSDATKQTWYGTFERKRKGKVPVLISTAPETVDLRLHTQWYRHASGVVKLPACNYIVSTLGLCIKSENVFLVQEYLPNGTLRDNLTTFEQPTPAEGFSETTLQTFVSFTMDITSGLDFLSAHGWVHPGLTTAKILLSFDKKCKLYDFCSLGDASVKLQSIIRKKGKERAKQLPPESFDLTDYTSRSDVWALGVVMWEMFSCGKDTELPKEAFTTRESCGGQLLKPEFCPAIVYRAITLCWARDPWSRPSFQDLKEYLNCAIEIHQLAKGSNKSRSNRPSDDLGDHILKDISYEVMKTPDISDTCL